MAVTSMVQGGIVTLGAANDTLARKMRIKKIRWVGATTAAHALELRCGAYGTTEVVYTDVATGANYVGQADFNPPLQVENLKATTLGSGTVTLYLD